MPDISEGSAQSKKNSPFIIVIVVLVGVILVETVLLLWMYRKGHIASQTNIGAVQNSAMQNTTAPSTNTGTNSSTTPINTSASNSTQGATSADAPKLVSATPANGAQISGTLTQVSLTFDSALDPSSTLKITRKSYDVTAGATIVSADKKTLTAAITATGTDTYTVNYTACKGQNSSCAIGAMSFHLDYSGQNSKTRGNVTTPTSKVQ